MGEKPGLDLARLANSEPFAHKWALCCQSFLFPEDRSPKERQQIFGRRSTTTSVKYTPQQISGVRIQTEEKTISEGLQYRGDAEIVEIAANARVVAQANSFECIAGSQTEPAGGPAPA